MFYLGDQNAIRPSEQQQQQQLSTENFITGKSEGEWSANKTSWTSLSTTTTTNKQKMEK